MLLAIDPGISGGLAFRDNNGKIFAHKMPSTLTEIRELIEDLAPDLCLLEKTGTYMPGNSGPAAVTFARHCGQLEGILSGLRVSFDSVVPGKWMKNLLVTVPKSKKERKNKIKSVVQQKFPHLKITLATSDALGILVYLMEQKHGN